jgi:predicted O-methyltransferase YrrM
MRPPLHYLLYRLGLASAETQTSPAERDCIARHAKNKQLAAEIGVWHGVTTSRIAEAIHASGRVHAVDSFPVGKFGVSFQERVARRETKPWANRITFQRGDSANIASHLQKDVGQRIDFIFIDGDHRYEGLQCDWEAWTPLIVPGGIVALHDSVSSTTVNLEHAGSVKFTREVILRDLRFQLLEQVDTLTVLRRL